MSKIFIIKTETQLTLRIIYTNVLQSFQGLSQTVNRVELFQKKLKFKITTLQCSCRIKCTKIPDTFRWNI